MDPRICVTLHDVAPATWPACARVLDAVREVGDIPLTLLLVPRYRGSVPHPSFEARMAAYLGCGHELALHGWTHTDELPVKGPLDWLSRRFYTAGEGEFATLGGPEAVRRLDAGSAWFAAQGWPLHGFVAPAWLLGPGIWEALMHRPFLYTSTLNTLHALHSPAGLLQLRCRSQVYATRSGWRRLLSLGWNRLLAVSDATAPLVRLELHPHDADHEDVRRSWQKLLRGWLMQRQAVTTAAFMRDWQAQASAALLKPADRPGYRGECRW